MYLNHNLRNSLDRVLACSASIVIALVFMASVQEASAQCTTCLGDVTGNDNLDAADIQPFADCLLAGMGPVSGCECADMDASTTLDTTSDVPLFVTALLTGNGPCPAASVLTLTLDSPLVGVTRTIDGMVCLDAPAGPGGVTVMLDSLDPLIATIAPPSVMIPQGDLCAPVTVTGVDFGTTTLTADAVGFTQGTAPITVTAAIISLGTGLQLIPGQTAGLPLSLSIPAPGGGVTVDLMSGDPTIATVTASVFIPAGQQIPAANPQVTGVALGAVDITATTIGFAPDTREVVVASNVIMLNPTTLNVVQALTADISVELQVSAPVGGQMIDISIDNPGIASAPVSAFISAGENSVDVTVTGVTVGTTTFRASSAASSIPEATATINVGPAGINLSGNTIGDDLEVAAFGTLTAAAPAGNLAVTITSDDPVSLLLSTDPAVAGSASIMVTVPAGSTSLPAFYVHALADAGSAGITATAPGYNPGSATFSFAPSGFIIWSPSVINTVTGLPPTSVQLRPVRLNPVTMVYEANQNLRGGIMANVDVMSSDPLVGTITISPVVFTGGEFFDTTGFSPVAAGMSIVSISTPPGFETPSQFQDITANVSDQGIVLTNQTIGDDLQVATNLTLTSPAPAGNLDVTVTSLDPARLLLSNNPTAVGAVSIIVTVAAGSTFSPTFYLQALDDTGTVDYTATAAGYGPGTATVTFQPSGFIIWSPSVINTVTSNPPTAIQIRPVRLNPATLNYEANQNVRGGIVVNVDVTSSVPAVGTITVSPVVFTGNEFFDSTAFDPNMAGMSQIDVVTPAGFDTPSNFQSIAATVAAQGINLTNQTIGDDLQVQGSGSLTAAAPAGNLNVTITSVDPARLLLANAPTDPGSASIVVTVPAGSSFLPAYYIYALDDTGTVDITATAAGYGAGTATITLQPSGFIIWTPGNFTTTTFSLPTSIQIRPVRLNPITLNYEINQNLRGGMAPVNVDVMSSDINVGVMTISPVVFTANEFFDTTGFDPQIAGMTDLSLGTPAGFDTPGNFQQITATVRAPNIFLSDSNVGEDLQVGQFISLEVSPPNPVDVVVTVNDPSIATISADPLAAGGAMVTFPGVTSTGVGTIYVQGRMQGMSTTITVQAAGYNDDMGDVDVNPSGFIIWSPGNFSTTTFSAPTSIQIRPVRLHPVTLNYEVNQNLRGGIASVNVDVLSSNTMAGTMTTSPIVFTANEFFDTTGFDPANAGMSTISVVAPAGFDTPSNFQSIIATVTAPDIFMSDSTVGEDLQEGSFVSLAATPPAPVDVTLTVADPSVAVISTDPLAAGSGMITFSGVSTTSLGTVYVQGLMQGMSTTITVSAPGYNNRISAVNVRPSGFIIWSPASFDTTYYSVPTSVQIRPVRLNAVTLNYEVNQNLRGGISPVNVDVLSSDTNVGTITVSPLVFSANEFFELTTFDPMNVGTSIVSVVAPAGFDTPSNFQMITATVTVPDVNAGTSLVVGEDLQTSQFVFLEAAPPAPVDVTITSNDPAAATVSTDPLVAGTPSVTFFGVTTTSVGTVYVHGLTQGVTTLTASAAGYASGNPSVRVDPSGFIIWSPSSISTTAASPPTSVQIRPVRLDPITFNWAANQNIRGGFMVDVDVTSSDLGVGTITISPLTFSSNEFFETTAFDPVAAGMCTVTVVTPAGFDPSSNLMQIMATVSP